MEKMMRGGFSSILWMALIIWGSFSPNSLQAGPVQVLKLKNCYSGTLIQPPPGKVIDTIGESGTTPPITDQEVIDTPIHEIPVGEEVSVQFKVNSNISFSEQTLTVYTSSQQPRTALFQATPSLVSPLSAGDHSFPQTFPADQVSLGERFVELTLRSSTSETRYCNKVIFTKAGVIVGTDFSKDDQLMQEPASEGSGGCPGAIQARDGRSMPSSLLFVILSLISSLFILRRKA